MTHEKAWALSNDLTDEGISHTVQVGIHDRLSSPVQCRVDISWPLRHERGFVGAVLVLAGIAERHDLTLDTDMLGQGITFNSKP